uniref:Cytochrome P450, family 17, subfamily A, polypeptide 2 n=1 Tax=Neogobius melanostomus TaxID=47308 RepID=A0A8C6UWP3_9GOBI
MCTRLLSSLSSVLSSPSLPFSLFSLFILLVFVLHLWRRGGGSSRPTLVRGPGVWRLQFGPWLWEEGHLTCFSVRCRLGPLFSMQLGPHFTLVVNSYDLAKEVLLTRGRDFAGRPKMLLTRGGKDIAFCDYSALWKSHRRLVHSALSLFGEGGRLQDIGKRPRETLIIHGCVDDLVAELGSVGSRAFDPSAAVTRAVTNVVCTLVFSATYRRDDAELKEVIDYNNGIVETIARGGLVDLFPWLQLEEQVGLERPVRLSDRTRLPYVEAVIQEGLRIRPRQPGPHSPHGHPVQPGTRVLVNMWALHHNPTDWPKPDLFNPRFLDGRGGRVSPSCFLPFGAGPRVCVGESLARLELFLFLSSLLQRISFSLPPAGPVPDLRGRLGVVLQPPPYLVVATPRHT